MSIEKMMRMKRKITRKLWRKTEQAELLPQLNDIRNKYLSRMFE